MTIRYVEIQVKSIITPSKLPQSTYVINPYMGCSHACRYCYAKFMKRFSNHVEAWGDFVDIKINALDVMPKNQQKYENQSITIGSVTDPYQPIEARYELTRKILMHLQASKAEFYLITKSPLIVRDIDLLKQFTNMTVLLSAGFHDDVTRKLFEPRTAPIDARLDAAKQLARHGIKTILFISPIFPELTDWKNLIERSKDFCHAFWFENLNLYPSLRNSVFNALGKIDKSLIKNYIDIYSAGNTYWEQVKAEIEQACQKQRVAYEVCFHSLK
ncbi:MAG: hypothetical protein A2X77_02970 [Gammaproteobacteria bacterium GWE2_42_36]|nr:MAG: hypothetical protein A2X77_02970 [Gammaproteobacteria bacterium GWE2_42_36]HCU04922.1 radical SAM protein [Coxiellaceae bacterium]